MNPTLDPSLCLFLRDSVHSFGVYTVVLTQGSEEVISKHWPQHEAREYGICQNLKVTAQNIRIVHEEFRLGKWIFRKQNL